jgi:hypothetical protein
LSGLSGDSSGGGSGFGGNGSPGILRRLGFPAMAYNALDPRWTRKFPREIQRAMRWRFAPHGATPLLTGVFRIQVLRQRCLAA